MSTSPIAFATAWSARPAASPPRFPAAPPPPRPPAPGAPAPAPPPPRRARPAGAGPPRFPRRSHRLLLERPELAVDLVERPLAAGPVLHSHRRRHAVVPLVPALDRRPPV